MHVCHFMHPLDGLSRWMKYFSLWIYFLNWIQYFELFKTRLNLKWLWILQDVGQSILESYSRVMESLAFNIIARIDDVIYVDDTTKRCAAVESMPLFSRGGLGCLPIQRRMSPSPFSIKHTPYGSPFATPSFCSSPISGRPGRTPSSTNRKNHKKHDKKPAAAESEKVWSYAGNISARRASGDAPERDWWCFGSMCCKY